MAFGKFGTYKKVEILIDAVEIIRKSSDEAIEIVIAGTDSPNTSGYLQQVKENMLTFLELYSPVTLRKIKSQLFLTKVRWWYFHILLRQEALVFCIRLEVTAAVVMPDEGKEVQLKESFSTEVQSLWQKP
jgi:hypothetical protein